MPLNVILEKIKTKILLDTSKWIKCENGKNEIRKVLRKVLRMAHIPLLHYYSMYYMGSAKG